VEDTGSLEGEDGMDDGEKVTAEGDAVGVLVGIADADDEAGIVGESSVEGGDEVRTELKVGAWDGCRLVFLSSLLLFCSSLSSSKGGRTPTPS
jgi:hypothetical protein